MPADTTIPDASAITAEAFVLAYPLVLASRTMAQATAVVAPEPDTMRAPINTLVHGRDTPDTLRSSGWLDLAAEPIVLSVPDTRGRYYVLWLRDAWDNVFASVGARTSGTAKRAFAVLGPGAHSAPLAAGLTPIAAPTRMVHVTGCIEAIDPDDDALQRACEGFKLRPLSQWSGDRPPATPAPVAVLDPSSPVEQVERMDALVFFSEVTRLVSDNPPDAAGQAVLDRLDALGAWYSPTSDVRASLERGVERGRSAVRTEAERAPSGQTVGRWRVCDGLRHPEADHLRRAGAARAERSAEPARDALHALLDCADDGQPLSGRCRYLVRFAPDAAPPALGFWSLTTSAGTLESAHSTGDLRGLTLDRDGSLPIHIQHRPPARQRRSNWLPTPPEGFSVALHLYWPEQEALERKWSPPPVIRVG